MANTPSSSRGDRDGDDNKLIPGWSLRADSQIIVVGLIVLAIILAQCFWLAEGVR